MNRTHPVRWAALTALALGVTAVSSSPSIASAPDPHRVATQPTLKRGQLHTDEKITSPVSASTGRQAYFVQLAGGGAATAASRSADPERAAKDRRSQVDRTAAGLLSAAKRVDGSATQLFTVSNAIPGVGLRLDPAGVKALAASSSVVKISRIIPKTTSNASVSQLVRATTEWSAGSNTGKGVRIGIIDTGIDFTHADFGGVGTPAAYDAARANSTAFNWRAGLPALGKAKVVGGYDFVGDAYNADSADPAVSTPNPDVDPLDCGGHGTHVAGTAAGYGVTPGGKTFARSYKSLTAASLNNMRVGPGMAPQAQLYALKVFGCEGSTNEVIPALDWSLDPNGDGDFSDHLDIINMSLGSDYGPADDPENDVVDALAKQGVLSVIAMGNNGDLTDTGGTPGNATSSLAVASSVDALQQRDGLKVNSPAGVAGITAGQMSVAYDWPNRPPVTGAVAAIPGPNADGCAALTAEDAAKVAGKVAWLEWDDNDATRRCGSVGRSANVKAAGAIGAIFTSALDVFGAGITGDADIPVFQLPRAGTQKLRPAAEAGTLNVTFDGALQATIKDVTPGIVDTLSSFSSRGPHGSIGVVKPDVTAVGDTVSSANMGTGNQVLSESGTSMATPVTAGVAALVKAAHPGWTPLALKAAVMNSAVHDVYTGNDRSGRKYAPARVGAGRIDARRATTTSVLAYVRGANNPVSASFGVVPAPIAGGTVTRTKTLAVRNVKGSAVKVNLSYRATNTMPGVSYSVSPSTLSIPRNGTATATVTLKVVPQQLRKPIDPTMAATQVNPFFGEQEARQYVADASGRLLVTPTGGTAYRVPVYSAPKPTSSTTAALRDGAIELSGNGIPAGAGATFQSLATVMELGTTSPRLPACGAAAGPCASLATDKGADIQHAGAGQSGDLMWFGVSTYGDWANLGTVTIPYVDYDTTGDGTPDFETYVQNIDGTDLLYAWTVRLATDTLVDLEPVNFQLGDVDTNVFDNNVVTMPVFKEAVDLPTDGTTSAPITYSVGTFSGVYGRDVDHTDDVEYDAGTPAVATDQELYLDADGTSIELAGTGGDGVSALVFHLQGAAGHRAEVLPLPATPPVG